MQVSNVLLPIVGTATVEQFGATVSLEFVIVGDSLYLKGPTGGFQKLPLSLASLPMPARCAHRRRSVPPGPCRTGSRTRSEFTFRSAVPGSRWCARNRSPPHSKLRPG